MNILIYYEIKSVSRCKYILYGELNSKLALVQNIFCTEIEKKSCQTASKWTMTSFNVQDDGVQNEILKDCHNITTSTTRIYTVAI